MNRTTTSTAYSIIREVEQPNPSPTSAADMFLTVEKSAIRTVGSQDKARRYLSDLYTRAFQKAFFESVTRVSCDRIRCHRKDGKVFDFSIRKAS